MYVITNPATAMIGDNTTGSGTYRGPCYHILGVMCPNCAPVRKSSSCPYCTPRCPHGYPADVAPFYPAPFYPATPWVTITNVAGDSVHPVNGGSTVMNMNYDLRTNPNVNFTYTSH